MDTLGEERKERKEVLKVDAAAEMASKRARGKTVPWENMSVNNMNGKPLPNHKCKTTGQHIHETTFQKVISYVYIYIYISVWK